MPKIANLSNMLGRGSEHSAHSMTSYGSHTSLNSCFSSKSGVSTKSNLSVGFSTKVKAKKIPRVVDYTEDERNAQWYGQDELEEIQIENKVTLKVKNASYNIAPNADSMNLPTSKSVKSKASMYDDDEDDEDYEQGLNDGGEERYCLRGLEKQTTKYQQTTKPFLQKSRAFVLEEQEKQRAMGINDPSRLAKISQQATKSEIREAFMRATVDKQIAESLAKADMEVGSTVSSENRAMALKLRRKEKLMRHSGSDLVELEKAARAERRRMKNENSGRSATMTVRRSTSGPDLRTL